MFAAISNETSRPALGGRTAGATIAAFRGTEATNLLNWRTDIQINMTLHKNLGGIHDGEAHLCSDPSSVSLAATCCLLLHPCTVRQQPQEGEGGGGISDQEPAATMRPWLWIFDWFLTRSCRVVACLRTMACNLPYSFEHSRKCVTTAIRSTGVAQCSVLYSNSSRTFRLSFYVVACIMWSHAVVS